MLKKKHFNWSKVVKKSILGQRHNCDYWAASSYLVSPPVQRVLRDPLPEPGARLDHHWLVRGHDTRGEGPGRRGLSGRGSARADGLRHTGHAAARRWRAPRCREERWRAHRQCVIRARLPRPMAARPGPTSGERRWLKAEVRLGPGPRGAGVPPSGLPSRTVSKRRGRLQACGEVREARPRPGLPAVP